MRLAGTRITEGARRSEIMLGKFRGLRAEELHVVAEEAVARECLRAHQDAISISATCRVVATFAETRAAAMGGHTELPHMRTWAVLLSALPPMPMSIRYESGKPWARKSSRGMSIRMPM